MPSATLCIHIGYGWLRGSSAHLRNHWHRYEITNITFSKWSRRQQSPCPSACPRDACNPTPNAHMSPSPCVTEAYNIAAQVSSRSPLLGKINKKSLTAPFSKSICDTYKLKTTFGTEGPLKIQQFEPFLPHVDSCLFFPQAESKGNSKS